MMVKTLLANIPAITSTHCTHVPSFALHTWIFHAYMESVRYEFSVSLVFVFFGTR